MVVKYKDYDDRNSEAKEGLLKKMTHQLFQVVGRRT
jgi:hypothetical protein